MVENFEEEDFAQVIRAIPQLLQKTPLSIRNAVKDDFSLERGIRSYLVCYRLIFKSNG
jgi:glycogen synthase